MHHSSRAATFLPHSVPARAYYVVLYISLFKCSFGRLDLRTRNGESMAMVCCTPTYDVYERTMHTAYCCNWEQINGDRYTVRPMHQPKTLAYTLSITSWVSTWDNLLGYFFLLLILVAAGRMTHVLVYAIILYHN